jgi:hypothetical protein
MARFAWDCMNKMNSVSSEAEIIFGPDTSNLSLRIGIHSGPVTGGFLKGRFQLFGDTINTAVQLARSGKSGCIQISGYTAKLLIGAGKKQWLEEHGIKLPGVENGEMQTYWLNRTKLGVCGKTAYNSNDDASSNFGSEFDSHVFNFDNDRTTRHNRLIDWNVEVLHQLLKQILVRRNAASKRMDED